MNKLLDFLKRCQRNRNKPDLHSFWIEIDGGKAYVDCDGDGVYIEAHTSSGVDRWRGAIVEAANRLSDSGAVFGSIDM